MANAINWPTEVSSSPADLGRRWDMQMNTPYQALSEIEKESDREQVRRVIRLIEETLSKNRG